jgi:predicted nucleic acid-binding protein
MIYGLDTSFLVQLEVREQEGHGRAHRLKERLLRENATFALVPQTLCEFVHVVTDPKRFERPLPAAQAVQRSDIWWNLQEVVNLTTTTAAVSTFHEWMRAYQLGRKRILDTMLAATLASHGVRHVISSDAAGFSCFGVFEVIDPLRS